MPIYNGYVLSVTIIKDDHLDCERMCIYNFPEVHGEYLTSQIYTIGTKLSIMNPYLRLGANDMKSMIRVDDPLSIIMRNESERVINMCRCCGKPKAPHACSRCKHARYCTKECQTMDWKLYKHKLICKT